VNCDELQPLLHGWLDGELDLVRALEVERHLEECPDCTAALERQHALRKALADGSLYRRAPAGLRERVLASLRPPPSRPSFRSFPWRVLAVVAAAACLAMAAWGAVRFLAPPSAEELLAQETVSNHVRSLMVNHLLDIPSGDQHTVKPWFADKLDFAFDVKKLDDDGFPLLGGRLEYLDRQKAAALVYKRHLHVINLFIRRAPADREEPPRALTHQGYHLIHWTRKGLCYWAVSDLNEQELREFAELIQR
jgi:anti-sigma factor RsiW